MGITLFDEALLSDIDDLPEIIDTPTSETPSITAGLEDLSVPTNTEISTTISNEAGPSPAMIAAASGKIIPLVQYTLTPLPSGKGKMVTFYLNIPDLSSRIVNQFIMLSEVLVQPTDALFIHLNSLMETNDSHIVYNALLGCKAKTKIACIPYALNTAAFYPALACNFIMPCKYGLVKFDSCSVYAGGIGHIDAKNAYNFDVNRKIKLLQKAHDEGFVTKEAMKNILENQGSHIIWGENLLECISAFNQKNRKR